MPDGKMLFSTADHSDIIRRLELGDLNDESVYFLRNIVDQLCTEYAYVPASTLLPRARQWLRRIAATRNGYLPTVYRKEMAELAGWLTLLAGCLEYDLGNRANAEANRRSAVHLGQELNHAGILGWAHEMSAWFSLTSGHYQNVLTAADIGLSAAGNHSVAIQLFAQQAKAWARLGRRAEMERALEQGRDLLDATPFPANPLNHFVIDPAKYDFYAMDCYRHSGDDRLAQALAEEVIRTSTDFSGDELQPMRIAEARVTLGVVAAKSGDVEEALRQGMRAIDAPRKCLPSLALVSCDLTQVLHELYPQHEAAVEYRRIVAQISQT